MNYLRAIRRSWYLVLIGLVFGAGAGWLAYHQATPSYRASVQLSVGYGQGQLADELAARALAAERAQAFEQIAGTQPVVAAAIKEAGLDNVGASVNAAGSASDSLFTITVVSHDRNAVAPIANAYPQVLIPQLTDIVGPLDSQVRLNTVQPASTPASAFSPVPSRDIGLGLIGGFLLGLLAALLIEVLDRAVRSPEEVGDIAGLPVLGTVPADGGRDELPTVTQPRSARAEAYRQVRTAWFALIPPAQVIAITSATQGEGKTTLATNLATAVSRSGHTVVVIDADLRRPRVASVFGLDPDVPGLAAVLTGEAEVDDVIRGTGEAMPSVIAAGTLPPDPSELLGYPAFEKLVTELRNRFDYVIVDTPPTLPVTDALVVAPRVDAMVLVVGVGKATPQRIRRTISALQRVNATVAGVVPNGAGGAAAMDYKYGYYYNTDPAKSAKRRSGKSSSGKRAAKLPK